MSLKKFPWGLTITVVIALAILIGLGVCQLYRLKWKEGVLAQHAALIHAVGKPLDKVLISTSDPAKLDMVRVDTECLGLWHAPTQRVFSLSADGTIINRLISACPLRDSPYDVILVDRGQVPEAVEQPPIVEPEDTSLVPVEGVLRIPQKPNFITRLITPHPAPPAPGHSRLWMDYDIPGIAAALGAKHPAPVFLAAETTSNPEWGELKPGLPTPEIPNNHMQYALTWFGLAIVMLCFYAAMLRQRLKGP